MRRALSLLLAIALTAGGLALGAATGAAAASGDPTLDGPENVFVSGTSIDVSGTDPNAVGGTVELALDGVVVAHPQVQDDATWQATVDLTGLNEDRHAIGVRASTTFLVKYVFVNRDLTSLQVTSPSAGATITSSTAEGCIPVAATLDAPGAAINYNAIYAGLASATGTYYVTPNISGTSVTACLPVATTLNGPADIFLWLSAADRSYLARTPVTIALTTKADVTTYVGTDGIGISGTITDKSPDTTLTASVDGGPAVPLDVQQARGTGPERPWRFGYWAEAWTIDELGDPFLNRALPDGPHAITLTLTSRGTTTTLGPYSGVIDHAGRLVIDTVVNQGLGIYQLEGTIDNTLLSLWREPAYDVFAESFRDGALVEKNLYPRYTWSTGHQYGQDRFIISVSTGQATGPATIQVSALSRDLTMACDAVVVDGDSVTPTSCPRVPPGVPTGLSLSAITPTSATLAFAAPAVAGSSPITGYTATAASAGVYPWPTFGSKGATRSIALSKLPANRDVGITVLARNAAGTSLQSRPVTLYTSQIFCNTKPKATTRVGTTMSTTCIYDSGLRNLYYDPDKVRVTLQVRRPGSTTWTSLSSKLVDVGVPATFSAALTTTTGVWDVRLVAPTIAASGRYPDGFVRPAVSATMATLVTGPAPKLTLALAKSRIAFGSAATFTGRSTPRFIGQRVYLERYSKGTWTTLQSKKLGASGTYSFTYKPLTRADLRYRVSTPNANGRPGSVSPSYLLTVL